MLNQVFGPVITQLTQGADPNAVAATSNVLASMFLIFNSGILILGAIIVSYVAVVGTINTASDGEDVVKRIHSASNSVWGCGVVTFSQRI
jgi:conjugal transfer/type IV secretion protein DotA/TraY